MKSPLPPGRCPVCWHRLGGAMAMDGHGDPRKGDLSVCMHCSAPLMFTADLGVRCLEEDERQALDAEERRRLEAAIAVARYFSEKGKLSCPPN